MSKPYGPLNPPGRLLLGPGPMMVEPRVYQALSKPIVGHLDPYFFQVVEEIRELLRMAFGTKNSFTMAISGTGSAGMEAAVANFVEPGDRVAIFANGYFCDRITEMVRRYGGDPVRLEKPWGEVFEDDEARQFLDRVQPRVVAFVHAETSTGALQQGRAICAAAHEVGALVIADCVTSLGGMPVNVDETGIDVAYSCSQKGLSCPPGLAPITVSERAMERLRARRTPPRSWYLDLKLLDDYYDGAHRYHHTAPISMFYALREALAIIAEEGLENRWERHRRNHLALVAGLEAMGLKMHVAPPHRLWVLNTPRVPDGIDDAGVRRRLLEQDGIEILGGFGPLAGKIFRIGLMGASSTEENVLRLLDALERALCAEGFRPAASGRRAAEQAYSVSAAQ
ncbi:MAG: alanine--glyoxylate aminotransferase family protein [Bryobacterales bacterium]|nr:alanine--glyoxylate aminotransferase family protein [Bryobacteraceae bacterium]MDW8354548.1 alanine--glyoxylate aminotransferase family protein [Bryobacterales bacterium]